MTIRLVRSRTSFFVGNTHVGAGRVFRSDDPLVVGREGLFEDVAEGLDVDYEVIERATAAPGEKRARKPRSKNTDSKEG